MVCRNCDYSLDALDSHCPRCHTKVRVSAVQPPALSSSQHMAPPHGIASGAAQPDPRQCILCGSPDIIRVLDYCGGYQRQGSGGLDAGFEALREDSIRTAHLIVPPLPNLPPKPVYEPPQILRPPSNGFSTFTFLGCVAPLLLMIMGMLAQAVGPAFFFSAVGIIALAVLCYSVFTVGKAKTRHQRELAEWTELSARQEAAWKSAMQTCWGELWCCTHCLHIFHPGSGKSFLAAAAQGLLVQRSLAAQRARDLETIQGGRLPKLPVSVMLKPGEVCHFQAAATLHEERITRRGYDSNKQSVRLRIAKGTFYQISGSRGRRIAVTGVVEVDRGLFFITNRRCLFIGQRQTLSSPHSQLVAFEPFENGVQLHTETTRKLQVFHFDDGEMAAVLLATIMRSISEQ